MYNTSILSLIIEINSGGIAPTQQPLELTLMGVG